MIRSGAAPSLLPWLQVAFFDAPGVMAALVATLFAGLSDGLVTFLRAPEGVRSPLLLAGVLFHCTAILLPIGLFVGVVQEHVRATLARHLWMRAIRVRVLAGPRCWFTPDRLLAHRAFVVVVGVLTATLLIFELVGRVTGRVRDPALVGLSIVGAVGGALFASMIAAVLVSGPAGWAAHRARRLASPGFFALAAASLLAAPLWLALRPYRGAFEAIGAMGLSIVALLAATALLDLGLLLTSRRPFRLPNPPWLAAAITAGAFAAVAVSGASLGREQTILSTILLRSVVTRHVVGRLQQVVDRDGDGYGTWFGGGDCDDENSARNPAARDLPGNGIDENCSGGDAPLRGPSDGARPATPSAPGTRGSVLFLSIDSVRPDHMSVYGYARPTTPNLSRFAERAVRFREAYTTSPQSVRSIASILTGKHAAHLSWRPDGRFPQLEPSNMTLAEALRVQGHATAAFLNTSYFSLTAGFFQGFELVQEGALFKDDARLAVSRAVKWLDERRRNEEPFFAWVHLIDPHAPYTDRAVPVEFGHEDADRYDEEIAATDDALGLLLDSIDRFERDGQSVLTVVFSDHGEAFGEHGHFHHADCLHDEVLRVPLLIRAPRAPSGEVRALVSLLDLHATALTFTGLPAPRGTSRSLLGVVESPETCRKRPLCVRDGVRAEVSPTYGSTTFMRALILPPWKLIHDVQHGAWELYNRNADPREQWNVFENSAGRVAPMRARLLDAPD